MSKSLDFTEFHASHSVGCSRGCSWGNGVDLHYIAWGKSEAHSLFFSRCLFNILSIDNIDNYAYNLFIPQKGVVMMKLNLMCMCRMCMRWPASCPLCVYKRNWSFMKAGASRTCFYCSWARTRPQVKAVAEACGRFLLPRWRIWELIMWARCVTDVRNCGKKNLDSRLTKIDKWQKEGWIYENYHC